MDNKLLALAYRLISNNVILDDYNIMLLQKNNINIDKLNHFINKINLYRKGNNDSLTINEQDFLYKMFGKDCLDKIIENNGLSSNNEKGKVNTLSNGKKQFIVDDAAFSEIYMFGFLVLIFQVLFLIISYIIFTN